ncbi:MAG: hypothetical protein SOI56_07140 [Eubacteriales bacterium]|jgi:hypothetical protein
MSDGSDKSDNRKKTQGVDSAGKKPVRRTPTELQPPLLKTRPESQSANHQNTGSGTGSSGRSTSRSTSASSRSANGRKTVRNRRAGNAAAGKKTRYSGSRAKTGGSGTQSGGSSSRRPALTPEEQKRRRARELQRKRGKRERRIHQVKMAAVIAVAAVAVIAIVLGIRKVVLSRAEAKAAAEAEAEAEQTLDTYDASEVLHLSFHVLALDSTKDLDNDGIPDTEDDIIDADGDGIADEGTDEDDDGIPDVHDDLIDADGDGVDDTEADVDSDGIVDTEDDLIDANGDGIADYTIDTDGDGVADTAATTTEEDTSLTVSEFNDILQDLYNQGYVLVSPYSLATEDENGLSEGTVKVPKGKKPLIISEQEVNYSEGYDGSADTLTLTSDGSITNTYTNSDGTEEQGSVDVITCLDDFIETHSDFSYDGARGIIGINGADGIFGYDIEQDTKIVGALSEETISEVSGDTSSTTETDESTEESDTSTDETTDSNTEDSTASGYQLDVGTESVTSSSTSSSSSGLTEEEQAAQSEAIQSAQEEHDTEIASNLSMLNNLVNALKDEGWVFACNSYNDVSYASTYDIVKADVDDWIANSAEIVGSTDLLLLPDGGDIAGWSGYTDSNEKFTYLKSVGFKYYFTESSGSKTWYEVGSDYVREGMHDIRSTDDYDEVMAM